MDAKAPSVKGASTVAVRITPPNIQFVRITIEGTAPLMTARLSAKTRDGLIAKFTQDEQQAVKKVRKARDLDADCEAAIHRDAKNGWAGFPASAIRAGMISACRTAGYKMTLAKLSLFVEAEGYDQDGLPLIQIHGKHERSTMPVRNATGVIDLRTRPLWREWTAGFTVRYDADQFRPSDIVNLLQRMGEQVGIGEGRADSRNSAGLGFGFFTVAMGES